MYIQRGTTVAAAAAAEVVVPNRETSSMIFSFKLSFNLRDLKIISRQNGKCHHHRF